MKTKEKVAVVLSGGGSKGAYQAGVWRALRKLNVKYHLVTGTSVGALNGMLMVQRDYYKCMKLWKTVDFDSLYHETFPDKYDSFSDMTKIYKKYASSFIKNGGMDTSKMQDLLYTLYNSRKFFRSPIDYGIITYNLTERREVAITKKDMTKKSAPEYLIASASCYPAFQVKDIDGHAYIDGGYTDNLPINLAISMGATSVIAVNLNAIGRVKKVKNTDIPITYIMPRNNLSSFLVFNPELSSKMMKYGYFDTMKVFDKLDGDYFTFKKREIVRNYDKYHEKFMMRLHDILRPDFYNKSIYDDLLKLSIFHKLLTRKDEKQIFKVLFDCLEYMGKLFKVDDTRIYTCSKFHEEIFKKLNSLEDFNIKVIEKKIREKDLKSLFHTATIVHYIYDLLQVVDTQKKRVELCRLAFVFPKEFIGAVYLGIIKERE